MLGRSSLSPPLHHLTGHHPSPSSDQSFAKQDKITIKRDKTDQDLLSLNLFKDNNLINQYKTLLFHKLKRPLNDHKTILQYK